MWAKNHCIPEHDVVVTRCSTNSWQNNLVKESSREQELTCWGILLQPLEVPHQSPPGGCRHSYFRTFSEIRFPEHKYFILWRSDGRNSQGNIFCIQYCAGLKVYKNRVQAYCLHSEGVRDWHPSVITTLDSQCYQDPWKCSWIISHWWYRMVGDLGKAIRRNLNCLIYREESLC